MQERQHGANGTARARGMETNELRNMRARARACCGRLKVQNEKGVFRTMILAGCVGGGIVQRQLNTLASDRGRFVDSL